MSALHPTTAALLARLRAADVQSGAHRAWRAAGCPDAPEPRFVPTEPGWYWRTRKHENDPDDEEAVEVWSALGLLWRRATETTGREVEDDGQWLGPVAPWAPPSEADTLPAAGGTGWTTVGPWTDDGGGRWVRIGYVGTTRGHAARAHADSWRFMPRKGGEALGDASSLADAKKKADQHLLPGFVWDTIYATAHPSPGPCPPKPRTAEEARANPMPLDRWGSPTGKTYALLRPNPLGGWNVAWSDGFVSLSVPPGAPGETYLGHFPLETS